MVREDMNNGVGVRCGGVWKCGEVLWNLAHWADTGDRQLGYL